MRPIKMGHRYTVRYVLQTREVENQPDQSSVPAPGPEGKEAFHAFQHSSLRPSTYTGSRIYTKLFFLFLFL